MGRRAIALLVIGSVLIGVIGCTSPGDRADDAHSEHDGGEDSVVSEFDRMAIGQLESLSSLTLWRVGSHAVGPGREPTEGIAAYAADNNLPWAFSIDGDGRFDGTRLPVSVDASPSEAQLAVVRVVETSTERQVEASWRLVDADTWSATARFAE
ncbi:hypothetical protein [Nocardioides sp. Root190]|uniref:hypothetical protein n=1 Tax=Nocardioides sp. Root190 TaxID=1736488 RepID=UPI0012F8FBFC|nr:hypothetical protein [Nocardioides sp. Root190]